MSGEMWAALIGWTLGLVMGAFGVYRSAVEAGKAELDDLADSMGRRLGEAFDAGYRYGRSALSHDFDPPTWMGS